MADLFNYDAGELLIFILVLVRISGIIATAPMLGSNNITTRMLLKLPTLMLATLMLLMLKLLMLKLLMLKLLRPGLRQSTKEANSYRDIWWAIREI